MTAHKRDWHRFIMETEPIEYESLTGFISRALAPTAIASFPLAMKLARVNAPFSRLNRTLLQPEELHRLAYLFGTKPSRLRKLSLQDASRVHWPRDFPREEAVRQANSLACVGVRRVSPTALREANFHRLAWDRSIFSFDPETLEPLLTQCPVCKVSLGWRAAGEPQYCDHCFGSHNCAPVDLRDYPQAPIKTEDAPALRFFGDVALPRTTAALDRLATQIPADWNSVSYRALSEIAVALAKLDLDNRQRNKRAPLSVEALARAGRVLLGGRAELRAALVRVHEHTGLMDRNVVFHKMGGFAQDLIYGVLPSLRSDRRPHLSVVEVNPAKYSMGRPDIQWRLQKVTSVDRVSRRVVRNPMIEPPWLWILKHSQTILQTSELLGIEPADIEVLVRRGIVQKPDPTKFSTIEWPDRIVTASVRLFMERVWQRSIEATDVDLSWIPFVPMYQFHKRYPMLTWASIMIALAESDIPRFRRHSKWPCWYYSLCVLDPHTLYQKALETGE